MKILNFKNPFRKREPKISTRNKRLLDDYNKGKFLKVGKDVDNKKTFLGERK